MYNSKNHSKFLLTYHIIFVVKYRKRLLTTLGKYIKLIMFDVAKNYNFEILEMEVDKDHIHLMISSEPKVSPLMIVRVLKQQSTFRIWDIFPNMLKDYFWKGRTFWTDGYFCSTIGQVSQETLRKYIENQG